MRTTVVGWSLPVALVLLLSACGVDGPVGDSVDTTRPTSSTTTTTVATTTTTEAATTTTTEPECVEREGVLYDSRGFVCPPTMKPIANAGSVAVADPAWYLAGTYTTQLFEPSFSFTRGTTFRSRGESVYFTVIDEPGAYMAVIAPEAAAEYRAYRYEEQEWVKSLTVSEVEYWGYPGSQIDFTVGSCAPLSGCAILILSLPFQWGWFESTQVRLLVVDVPDGPIGFQISGPQYRFDQYWTEVAEPILASIEFLDQ